ncbi:MAG: DUF3137 domain-containing protein, partial [Candidatus Gastranaerophilales bacterium]|nr:DUF3137 domain-containing protein [Candidatus Gastranaerophilales bacterium]
EEYINIKSKINSFNFDKFCHKNFYKHMIKLEKVRIFYLICAILCFVAGVAVIAGGIYFCYFITPHSKNTSSAIEIIFLIGTIVFSLGSIIIKHYKTRAKEILLDKLLSYFGCFKRCKYNNNINYIHNLKLFDSFNRHSFDDHLKGQYGSLNIDITEMCLKRITHSGKHTHEVTIFKGLLITLPSLKKFKGDTIIKKNFAINFGEYNDLKKVNLEDPEFEKIYDVYSTDQIEARYLITAAFMNRMVKLAKKGIGENVTLSFEKGKIHIAISSSKDWFEIPILKQATRIENYRAIIIELISILRIIDSLKLDQNIGM